MYDVFGVVVLHMGNNVPVLPRKIMMKYVFSEILETILQSLSKKDVVKQK